MAITGWQRNTKNNKPSRSDSRVFIKYHASVGVRISNYQYYWWGGEWVETNGLEHPVCQAVDEDVIAWAYVDRK